MSNPQFKRSILAGAVLMALSSACMADALSLQFQGTAGDARTVPLSQQYINPVGSMTVMIETGLEKLAEVELLNSSGSRVAHATTNKAGSADKIVVDGTSYFGFNLAMDAPAADGDYTLKVTVKNADGTVFSQKSYPLTLDRQPPTLASPAFFKEGPYGHVEANGRWHLGYYEQFKWGITGVSNADSVTMESVPKFGPKAGTVAASSVGLVDAANSRAYIGGPSHFSTPDAMGYTAAGEFELRFIVKDRAGNVTTHVDNVYWGPYGYLPDGSTPSASVIAVYDPDAGQSTLGQVGYRPYIPGMTLQSAMSSLKVLVGYEKKFFTDSDPIFGFNFTRSGWKENYFDAGNMRYRVCELPTRESQGSTSPELCGLNNETSYLLGAFNVSVNYADASSRSPVVKAMELFRQDNGQPFLPISGWFGLANPLPALKVKWTVEPRPYTQVYDGGCTIPAGATSCEANLSYVDPASGGTHVRRVGYDWPGTIYRQDATSMRAWDSYNNIYMDYDKPVIKSVVKDGLVYKINGVDVSEGGIWSTVTVAKAQVKLMPVGGGTTTTISHSRSTPAPIGRDFTIDLATAGLADGSYNVQAELIDNYGNVTTQDLDPITLDTTPPSVTLLRDGAAFSDGKFTSLSSLSFRTSEPASSVSVMVVGGPKNEKFSVPTAVKSDGSYSMGFLPLMPGDYSIEITAKDASGNGKTLKSTLTYDPPRATLAKALGTTKVIVPKTTTPIKVASGLWPLTTEAFKVQGTALSGVYDLHIKLLGSSGGVITVDGQRLDQASELVLKYDFSAHDGRLELPIGVPDDSAFTGQIIVTPEAPDTPVFYGDIEVFDLAPKVRVTKPDSTAIKVESVNVTFDSTDATAICGDNFVSFIDGETPDYPTRDGLLCAVRFSPLPQGITRVGNARSFALKGVLPTVGDHPVTYQYGFISEGNFQTVSATRSINLIGVAPKPIVLGLQNQNGEAVTSVKKGDAVMAGSVSAKSAHSAPFVVEVTGDVLKSFKLNGNRADTPLTSPVAVKASTLWGYSIIKSKAWYVDAPEVITEAEYQLRVVPNDPIIVLDQKEFSSTSDMVVTGRIGKMGTGTKRDVFSYDSADFGNRNVAIVMTDATGKDVSTSSPVSVSGDTFSVNLGTVEAGTYFLVAQSSLVDPTGADSGQVVKSQRSVAVVRNGSPLTSKIAGRTLSGPTPFVTTLTLTPDDTKRYQDIGEIRWYVSNDKGASWERALDAKGKDAAGAGYVVSIKEPAAKQFKAVVVNRFSGEEFTTPSLDVVAYHSMKLTIDGATSTIVGQPTTLTAGNSAGADARYSWEVSKPGGKPFLTADGASITITPETAENLVVKLSGVDVTAPDDEKSAVLTTYETVRVAPAKMFPASITGPRIVEVGKSYTFTSQQTSAFSAGAKVALTTDGEWVLPNGSRVKGTSVTYTPQPGDKSIAYETWYVEKPSVRATGTHYYQSWQYAFPEFSLQARVMNNMTPLMVSLAVTPKIPFKTMGDDKLSYEWSIPNGVEATSIRDSVAVLSFPKSGVFQPAVTIKDTRGNSQTLMTEAVKIDVGGKVTFDVTPVVSDRWQRAPSAVAIQIKNLKVPYGDRYAKSSIYLNGEKQVETTGISTVLNVPKAGDNKLRVVAEGQLGSIGEVEQVLTLKEGSMPSCTLVEAGNKVSSLSVTARCSVSEGYVTGYKWLADGVEMPVKGSTISFTAQQIQAGIHEVVVEATTDKGKTDRFTLNR